MTTEPFNIPELKNSTGLRLSKRDKQNLRILMVHRRDASLSNIIKWALEQQAEPVRQAWQATASRIAREEEEKEAHADG